MARQSLFLVPAPLPQAQSQLQQPKLPVKAARKEPRPHLPLPLLHQPPKQPAKVARMALLPPPLWERQQLLRRTAPGICAISAARENLGRSSGLWGFRLICGVIASDAVAAMEVAVRRGLGRSCLVNVGRCCILEYIIWEIKFGGAIHVICVCEIVRSQVLRGVWGACDVECVFVPGFHYWELKTLEIV